jgi:GNAT superfamily N-acetyltransferase
MIDAAESDRTRRDVDGLSIRGATGADLAACERIWRDGINDYLRPLNLPDVPLDNPGLRRLHEHTLATDPAGFAVAERAGQVVAFGSVVRRGRVAFLSMLFVDPAEQRRGLGRRILGQILPALGEAADSVDGAARATILATATDSAQPISNGLYASLGIVPRMPLLNLVGRPRPGWTPPTLPPGISAAPLPPANDADREVDELDLELIGFVHPQDHAFALADRADRFGYRDPDGRLVGYGYTSAVGRIGPVAVRDRELMGGAIGHLLTAVEPRGASALWIPGGAGAAVRTALDAGLRFEDFPLLLCWSDPFADFERYLPLSPGLL